MAKFKLDIYLNQRRCKDECKGINCMEKKSALQDMYLIKR
ncbi:hypothetical protein NitYY0918_C0036 [Nitratiruptor sp. YY09-18]|nr:hypothetical protein NitYY0918_C0036 [Nitratiruptor sp. YY09-18]